MAYTVKKLAAISGVSVRTLHYYDEAGLLNPAYRGANGYRYYEEPQLLVLQQILFYRELGFELEKIRSILRRRDFDKLAALESHKEALRQRLTVTKEQIATIEKTIEHLKGKRTMKAGEMFSGFNPKEQKKHEDYLVARHGDGMKSQIQQSKKRVKQWTREQWIKSGECFNEICRDLAEALKNQKPAQSPEAQAIVRRHHDWMTQFWTPTRESYSGHSRLIVDSELRKPYEAHHPQLPEYVAEAISVFAQNELK